MGIIDMEIDFIDRQEGHSSLFFGVKVSNRYRKSKNLCCKTMLREEVQPAITTIVYIFCIE